MAQPSFTILPEYRELPLEEMQRAAEAFLTTMRRRRTVRDFSSRGVPRDVIENCLSAAGTAPSGANQQPWHFVVVGNPNLKREIRQASEEEERAFYDHRAPQHWLDASNYSQVTALLGIHATLLRQAEAAGKQAAQLKAAFDKAYKDPSVSGTQK